MYQKRTGEIAVQTPPLLLKFVLPIARSSPLRHPNIFFIGLHNHFWSFVYKLTCRRPSRVCSIYHRFRPVQTFASTATATDWQESKTSPSPLAYCEHPWLHPFPRQLNNNLASVHHLQIHPFCQSSQPQRDQVCVTITQMAQVESRDATGLTPVPSASTLPSPSPNCSSTKSSKNSRRRLTAAAYHVLDCTLANLPLYD